MKQSWNIAALVGCATVIIGSVIVVWHFAKARPSDRKLFETAKRADQGDADAEYRLGVLYQQGKGVRQNYAEALRWYRKAADQDHAKAEYALAYMYSRGDGVSKDEVEAVRWSRKAAQHGEPNGECFLGSSYYYGRGVPQDLSQAAQWYRRAADHGSATELYDLGFMYYYGQGVQQDRIEAGRLFREAASRGDQAARGLLHSGEARSAARHKFNLSLMFLGSLLFLISGVKGGQGSLSVAHDMSG